MLDCACFAIGTIQPMNRELENHLMTASHRFAMNATASKRLNRYTGYIEPLSVAANIGRLIRYILLI